LYGVAPGGGEIAPLGPLQITDNDRPPDITEALLGLASVTAQILAHMARWQGQSAPDAPPPEQVFRELLAETLRPVLERHPPAAIEAARGVLFESVEMIESEILLVAPPGPPSERRNRSRSGRRRRG
jgi:hypothetical protein